MSTRQIASSTLWQLGSQIVMAAISILTVKFIAIGLSKELAGNYNSAYGFLQLFGILADFGLYAVAVREVARSDRREEVLGTLLVIRFCILLMSLGLAVALIWLLPQWRGTPLPMGVTLAAFVPFFTLLAGMIRTVFQVSYKMHYVFIAEVTQRLITVSCIGITIWLGVRQSTNENIYLYYLLVGGIGAAVLLVVSLICANRIIPVRPHWNSALLKRLAAAAAPYGLAFVFMALYRQFDVTMIALLREDFEIQNAYYGFVMRMTDMGFLIPTFLLNSTLPILSARAEKGEDTRLLLGKTLLILLLLGTISCLFAAFWSRPLVLLLTTEAYISTPGQPGSDDALRLLSVPLLLNAVVLYGFYVLLTTHRWRRLVGTLAVAAALSLTLNITLIPELGFVGAATTSIIVHVVLSMLLLPQALRVLPATLPLRQIGQWLVFSAVLGTALYLTRPLLTGSLQTIVGLVTMTLLMILTAWLTGLHRSLGIVIGKKA